MKKVLILLLLFLLTGCWNYQELNSIAISTAIGVDKNDDGKYEVSTMIANSRKEQSSSKESESQSIIFTGVGNTISEAFKDIDLYNPRRNYIGHVSVVVISDEVAKDGLNDILDFSARNPESTKRFQMVIAKNCKAKDILKILTPLETFSAQNISNNLKYSRDSQATSTSILYSDFIYNLLEKGMNPILPSVILKGDKKDGAKDESLQQTVPDAFIKINNLALFKDYKLVGFANANESRGINLLKSTIEQLTVNIKVDNKYITFKLLDSKTKSKIKFNDKPIINVEIKGIATLVEDNSNHSLTDQKVMKEIEKKINKKIEELANQGLEIAKKNNTDVFGYGNLIYKNYPNYFKKFKDWDKEGFKDLDVKIKSNVVLSTTGSAKTTLKGVK